MGGREGALLFAAVDVTFAAGPARFRCQVTGDTGRLASCEGVVDFHRAQSAMNLTFDFPSSAPASAVEVRTIIDNGTVYVRVPSERGVPDDRDVGFHVLDFGIRPEMPESWIALDTDTRGLAALPTGAVVWLRGVTATERVGVRSVAGSSFERFRVSLDLDAAVHRSPEPERGALRAMLEGGQVGLASAATHGEVELDHVGRVRWMWVAIPPGTSPWFLVAAGERTVELELYEFDIRESITVPDAEVRMRGDDFVRSITVEDDPV